MGEFDDMVNDEVAQTGGSESEAPSMEDAPEPSIENGETEGQGNSGDSWTPPSREEWTAMQAHAELGKRYAPHARNIDSILARAFDPPQQGGQHKTSDKSESEDSDYDKLLGTPDAYTKTLNGLNEDPRVFEKVVSAIFSRKYGDRMKALEKYEKQLGEVSGHVADLRAYNELIAPRRFGETPEWKQHGKGYLELLNSGLADPQKAWELAALQAMKAGATPAQAKAAGNAAAVQAQASQQRSQRTSQQLPRPHDDKSLKTGQKRPTGAARDEAVPFKKERSGKWEQDLVKSELLKAGARV